MGACSIPEVRSVRVEAAVRESECDEVLLTKWSHRTERVVPPPRPSPGES
ncbi:hypothetical protein NPIL_98561, partial [Nephila pilipes]